MERDERGPLTPEQGDAFVTTFVACFNAGARTADFRDYLKLFAEDAVLEFEGIPDWGPFEGREAIARRLVDAAPDDEIRVGRRRCVGSRIVAQFVWTDVPEASGGSLSIDLRDGKIAHLSIAFGGPAARFRA